MRAWAILMMLQGHFIDGLLDPVYGDPANTVYSTWKYFRGITAPVFFTVSGFIFTYLLLRAPRQGSENPRIRKGLKRGLELLAIGYLLRTNLLGLLQGVIYPSFFLVDVLHCIGAALLIIVGLYLLSHRIHKKLFPYLLLGLGILLFLFEPVYKSWGFEGWPAGIANYFTKANGSVFTVIPWVGYAALGGFMAWLFRAKSEIRGLYIRSIVLCMALGGLLIWFSSPLFDLIDALTGIGLFQDIVANNYLFIRLGDVLLVFAVFMILRRLMHQELFLRIGQNTLSIYVIHFIILYGSFTGLGLYRFFDHSLPPLWVIPGALAFMIGCTWLALVYDSRESRIINKLRELSGWIARGSLQLLRNAKTGWVRLVRFLGLAPNR